MILINFELDILPLVFSPPHHKHRDEGWSFRSIWLPSLPKWDGFSSVGLKAIHVNGTSKALYDLASFISSSFLLRTPFCTLYTPATHSHLEFPFYITFCHTSKPLYMLFTLPEIVSILYSLVDIYSSITYSLCKTPGQRSPSEHASLASQV